MQYGSGPSLFLSVLLAMIGKGQPVSTVQKFWIYLYKLHSYNITISNVIKIILVLRISVVTNVLRQNVQSISIWLKRIVCRLHMFCSTNRTRNLSLIKFDAMRSKDSPHSLMQASRCSEFLQDTGDNPFFKISL